MSRSNIHNQTGNYGSLGVPSSSNIPGSRQYSVVWTTLNESFWLFGGISNWNI